MEVALPLGPENEWAGGAGGLADPECTRTGHQVACFVQAICVGGDGIYK